MSRASSPPLVNCPVCGKSTPFTPANRFRPFCSERCKLIDLGNWASESYRVPEHEPDENSEDGKREE